MKSKHAFHADVKRPAKRTKDRTYTNDVETSTTYHANPYHIVPSGNLFLDVTTQNENSTVNRPISFGELFGLFPDELMLHFLSFLNASSLSTLSMCNKRFYVFCHENDLWRTLALNRFQGNIMFRHDWKTSYMISLQREKQAITESKLDVSCAPSKTPSKTPRHKPLSNLPALYSDILFHNWNCAMRGIPSHWLQVETISRVTCEDLTLQQFDQEYSVKNRPVIITGNVMKKWDAMSKWKDRNYLLQAPGNPKATRFNAGGYNFSMQDYFDFMDNITNDDQPLYLFDKQFFEKCPSLVNDYKVPEYFQKDYFSILEPPYRPDYRWLIMGPRRSGSTFHMDPNATSAWNAVITGSKKWIMFPPHVEPPGVGRNRDMSAVTAPLSVIEWFVNFYDEASKHPSCLQGVCRAGEVIFVPSGWWHCVLNLEEDNIAITQNFVNDANLVNVILCLRKKSVDHISGVHHELRCELADKFESAMRKEHRKALEEAYKQIEAMDSKLKVWSRLKSAHEQHNQIQSDYGVKPSSASFSFGFSLM